MTETMQWTIDGQRGHITVREWPNEHAQWLAVLAHGYGEHIGRYNHVAEGLRQAGAAVVGPDHQGHGQSSGENALIEDFEEVVTDLHMVTQHASEKYRGLPVILIGHSMGGMIAGRYGQRYSDELAALVLSGPSYGTLPLLWIHGELDPLIPLAATRPVIEHLRGSRFEEHIYSGALHEIFNETNRADVIADVVSFAQRILSQK